MRGDLQRTLPILALLLAASAGVLSSTWVADQAVRSLARQSLESSARGISLAAEQVLRAGGGTTVQFERLFSDRVVAYALIADTGGTILFHTNPDLRGTALEDRGALDRAASGEPASRRAVLGTGRRSCSMTASCGNRTDGQPCCASRCTPWTSPGPSETSASCRTWWSGPSSSRGARSTSST